MQQRKETTIVRFNELKAATMSPPDTELPQYRRERYTVLGRAAERAPATPGANADVDISFGLMKCTSGTGNGSHAHGRWEIFIILAGRWKMTLEGGPLEGGEHELELGPWDVIVLPPNVFHAATNISDGDAWLMALNPDGKGQPFTLHPSLIRELKAWSEGDGRQ